MTNRENALAILGYGHYDRVPVVHFGFWPETVAKWADEGHVPQALAEGYNYQNDKEDEVARLLGFDFGWGASVVSAANLFPGFDREILETFPDGRIKVRDVNGAIVIEKPGTVSIPSEVGHTLQDRASWDSLIEPRLRWSPDRVDLKSIDALVALQAAGGPATGSPGDKPIGIWCGSLYGTIRDMLGMENCAYLQVDDPDLYGEIIDRIGSLALQQVDATLKAASDRGLRFDFAHYWEDICFKNGPLISPSTFDELVGPWYRKISDRLAKDGINLSSLDCDGMIDALLPTWVKNGVNVMFPIEVGTWKASLAPWREKYGRALRGVGGMEKYAFAKDRKAIDAEIERLKALVDLGGFIPCPDHRIPPDAEWDNVAYYCEVFRKTFGA